LYRRLNRVTMEYAAECGGKAARLGEAMRFGCPVPDGVVLYTEMYRRFMRLGGLQGEIASILAAMQPTAMHHFHAVEWAVRSAFSVRRLPDEMRDEMVAAWHSIGGGPVAVRSSATREDGPECSFVGQHATSLNVTDEDALIEAVIACWMSLFSAKALSYAHHFGIDLLNSSMAVLIQRMITPTCHGVLLTADPITGDPDVFVLEVNDGPRAGVHRLDPYERQPGEPWDWTQLRRLGLLLDERFGAYQAIEWVIADGSVQLLRVRPATRIPAYLPVAVRDVGAEAGPLELIRQDGVMPRTQQPYTWYHRSRSPAINAAHFRSVQRSFAPYAGRDEYYIRGYLYARWRPFAFPPVGEGLRGILQDVQRLLAARKLDAGLRALWRAKRARLDALKAIELTTLTNPELAHYLQEVIALGDAFIEERGRVGDSPRVLADILMRLHRRWFGDTADCQDLLLTTDDQLSRRDEALCQLARTAFDDEEAREAAFRAYVREFRHLYLRGEPLSDGQDICRLEVDEAAALEAWQSLANDADASCDLRGSVLERRRRAEARVVAQLNRLRRAVYRSVLWTARAYAPWRTDCDEPILLCWVLEAEVVREVGRRLRAARLASDDGDGVYLGVREITDWLQGGADNDRLIRAILERKELSRHWQRYAPPDILGGETASPPVDIVFGADPRDIVRGRPISPGIGEGKARVVSTLTEAASVLPGEVLVCRRPDFELSPFFGIVSAVVSEEGGLLDHAATLAREYGVPAIFGARGATTAVRTGDDLQVDANRGIIVRRIPEVAWELL
jgi:phosphohistidine swiveling domain-containing protein